MKMHGLGNDFVVYVDFNEKTTPSMVRKICKFHTGVGADGVITVTKSRLKEAKYRMKYFNADGSTAEMCGNGIRCFAKYLLDNKLVSKKGKIPVETGAGLIIPEVLKNLQKEALVRVNMGKPVLQNLDQVTLSSGKNGVVGISLEVKDKKLKGTYISIGNPHVVFFVDNGLAKKYAKELGPEIEKMTSIFPKKVNVEFVEVNNKKDLTMHVWERGVGLTLACGTGACAVLAVSVLNGYSNNTATIHLPGGDLEVSWKGGDSPIYMTGSATNVFEIKDIEKLLLS